MLYVVSALTEKLRIPQVEFTGCRRLATMEGEGTPVLAFARVLELSKNVRRKDRR